jgi:hypothetical protein
MRLFPRKGVIKYKFKTHEEFNKQTLLVATKKEFCDCLDETLKYVDSVNDTNSKFRKDRTKKVSRILDDNIKKMKYNLSPSS